MGQMVVAQGNRKGASAGGREGTRGAGAKGVEAEGARRQWGGGQRGQGSKLCSGLGVTHILGEDFLILTQFTFFCTMETPGI